MAFYRKRPVVVEAVRFTGIVFAENSQYSIHFDTEESLPDWLRRALVDEDIFVVPLDPDFLFIKTLEGLMEASPGDWIVRGVKGELYPCKADIFSMTYDLAPRPEDEVQGAAI
jgi:hypothetical protein